MGGNRTFLRRLVRLESVPPLLSLIHHGEVVPLGGALL